MWLGLLRSWTAWMMQMITDDAQRWWSWWRTNRILFLLVLLRHFCVLFLFLRRYCAINGQQISKIYRVCVHCAHIHRCVRVVLPLLLCLSQTCIRCTCTEFVCQASMCKCGALALFSNRTELLFLFFSFFFFFLIYHFILLSRMVCTVLPTNCNTLLIEGLSSLLPGIKNMPRHQWWGTQ